MGYLIMDKIRCSYDDVEVMCNDLQQKVSGYKFDYIVAVSRGGLLPGVILSHKMGIPLYPVVWSTRDYDQRVYYGDIAEDLTLGKTILLVDDINDTGKTFLDLIDDWSYNKEYGTLITATMYQRYTTKLPSHYYSVYIDNDAWVEFPWEKK